MHAACGGSKKHSGREARRGARVLQERVLTVGALDGARLVEALQLDPPRIRPRRARVEKVAVREERSEERAQRRRSH